MKDTKNVIVLYEDNTSSVINENNLTPEEFGLARYLLIPIEALNREYVCVRPTKYMDFTTAYIQYQLSVICYDENEHDEYLEEFLLEPVHVTTESLCDVIGLINSADRLMVTNECLVGDYHDPTIEIAVGIHSFSVILMNGKTQIYHSEYVRSGTQSIPYDSYSVTKKFKKLYDISAISEFYLNAETLDLINRKKDSLWRVERSDMLDADLKGVPCLKANTITFLTPHEMKVLRTIKSISIDTSIFYARNDRCIELCEGISNGHISDLDQAEELMEELFVDTRLHVSTCLKDSFAYEFVEIVANACYTMDILQLVYSELYGQYSYNLLWDQHSFLVLFYMIFQTEKNDMSIIMNTCSMLSLSDILELINERGKDG